MKKIIAVLTSILLLGCFVAQAQEDEKPKKRYEVEKKKIYEKTYALGAGDKVKITNQFGFVKINTWNKSEINVKVEIIASAKSESRANNLLESLSITDKKVSNVVSFKTSIDNDRDNGGSQTMEINYTVFMPSNNSLDLKNEFGATTISDFEGMVDITSKFGSLTTGKLTNIEEILVEFGKAKIESMKNGTATFKFSKAEVNHLVGSNSLKFEFCDKSKVMVDNDATSVNINESYSKLYIIPSANFSANYNVRTSFGSFKNRTGNKFTRADEEPDYGADTDKEYEGQRGSGACKVKIKSSFGNIILGQPTTEEMNDEKKKKKKNDDDDDNEEA
ncbi:MAG: hypothetical protein KA319_03995 [Ferruginibacter sp.]|nr:hypothetical protein [Ferruginibacter sp.]